MPVISRRQWETGERPSAVALPESLPEVPAMAEEPELESVETSARKKPKPEDPWFILQHPDATSAHDVECSFKVTTEGEEFDIVLEHSRVETQEVLVRDELRRRGYRWMNEEF